MPLEGIKLGRYRLIRVLGSGGMGEVYLAEDTGLNRQVAVKVIRTELGPYPDTNAIRDARHQFGREMNAVSKLDHPSVLPLFDYGEQDVNGVSVMYMVTPFRHEGSFAMWLRQRSVATPLSPQDVAYFTSQGAEALQHAHDRHIIHQDVKPTNFLIRSGTDPSYPHLLLADFGVAKITSATASVSQNVRGTPNYMAPEQWNGLPVPATDQYALAVMAYELLTGRSPFTGTAGQIMFQHLTIQPQPPSSLNPGISPAVDAVILRTLAKKPEDRFPSISVFAQVFQQAIQTALDPTVISTANAPTVLSPTRTRGDDIHTTLLISKSEAATGISRKLTIQGRPVTVQVPANTHDGQIFRMEGQGSPSKDGGPAGVLIISIIVDAMPSTVAPTLATINRQSAEKPREPIAATPRTLSGEAFKPLPKTVPPLPPPAKRSPGIKAFLLIVLLIFVILGGFGLYAYVNNSTNNYNPAPVPVSANLSVNPNSLNANSNCNSGIYSTSYISRCSITVSSNAYATEDLSWTWNSSISQNGSTESALSEILLRPNSGGGCGLSANPASGILHPGEQAIISISICAQAITNPCPGKQVDFRFDGPHNSVNVIWRC